MEYIAIYNATQKELLVVDSNLQVQNYWRETDADDVIYTLEDFAFVDSSELADYDEEAFEDSGWVKL